MKVTTSTVIFINKNKDLYNYFEEYIRYYNKIWLKAFYKARDNNVVNCRDSKFISGIKEEFNISNRSSKVLCMDTIGKLKAQIALKNYYYNMYSEKVKVLSKQYKATQIIVEKLKEDARNNKLRNLKYYKAQKSKLWALGKRINRFNQKLNSIMNKKIKCKRHSLSIGFMGSHGETCHNQQFQVTYNKKYNRFDFKMRRDNGFIENNKYITGSFYVKYLKKEFIKALDKNYNKPISYRIIYRNKRLYLYITLEVEDILISTRSNNGVIGIDFNKEFISVSEVNSIGNLINTFDIKYKNYKHKGKNKESMISMITQVCMYAKDKGKDIIIEDLDFTKKKSSIIKKYSKNGKTYNNFVITFPYKQFRKLMIEKCKKEGIGLELVNPAYTSKKGEKLKYRMKLRIHNIAAYIIARKYMGFNKNEVRRKKKIEPIPVDYLT